MMIHKSLIVALVLFLGCSPMLNAQLVSIKLPEKPITIEKAAGEELLVSLPLELRNFSQFAYYAYLGTVRLAPYVDKNDDPTQFLTPLQLRMIQVKAGEENILINSSWYGFDKHHLAITLVVAAELEVEEKKKGKFIVYFDTLTVGLLELEFLPPLRNWYSPQLYQFSENLQLSRVSSAEFEGNRLVLKGYRKNNPNSIVQRNIILSNKQDYFYHSGEGGWHWFAYSLMYAPIRFRFQEETPGGPTPSATNPANLLLNLDFLGTKSQRFYRDGRISHHKFALGVFCGFTVNQVGFEMVVPDGIDPNLGIEVLQERYLPFLSFGLSLTYAVNNVHLYFIPLGMDVTSNRVGRENPLTRKPYMAFGIGISPQVFKSK